MADGGALIIGATGRDGTCLTGPRPDAFDNLAARSYVRFSFEAPP